MTAGARTQLVLDRTSGQVFSAEYFNPIKEGNISPESLKFLEIFAFLGTIRLETATLWVVVTEATTVAMIGKNKIMSIRTVELKSVNPYWQPDANDLATQGNLQKVRNRQFFTTGFYFSDSIDITNSLQRIQGRKGNLHVTANPQFYWNLDMYSDLVRAGVSPKWFVPAIQGFVSSANEFYSTNQVELILISRRSCLRAGTSEVECGLDDDGNVANFIETEQIVRLAGNWYSFVQVRGTVPVFWQLGGATRSLDSTSPAFKRHFDSLVSSYKHVMVINLLSTTKSEEVALNAQFNELLQRHQQSLEPSVCYFVFDYKTQCKGDKHANIRTLMSQIAEMLTYYGYFSMQNGQMQSIQKGVPRLNCFDCLDRTNLTMARIAWEVLSRQFQMSGFALELDYDNTLLTHPLLRAVRNMWADNGDMLSRIYIGVGSASSHITRTGKQGLKAFIKNKVKTVERLLNPTGERRQDTIELVLGNGSQRKGPENGGIRGAESTQKLPLAVHICTWNLAGNRPPENENLSHWLIDPENPFPELVVVGLQEMVPLNTKHVLGGSDQGLIDTWKQLILSTLNQKNRANYCWVQSQDMVGCLLSLFALEHMLPHITGVDRDVVKVGFGNMAGNKGGVLLRFNIKDTSLCFWDCHLESGMDQVDARFNQLTDICTRGFAGRRKVQTVAEHDVKVLLGDLNFRISLKYAEVLGLIDQNNLTRLKQFDQLLTNKRQCPILTPYTEGDITFLPTYKYDKNSTNYDTSKKMRVPAWCDRILCAGEDVVLTSYRRSENLYSDHRPVSATMMVAVKRIVVEKRTESEGVERHRNSGKVVSGLPTASIRPPNQQLQAGVDLLSLDDSAYLSFNIKTQQRNSEPPNLGKRTVVEKRTEMEVQESHRNAMRLSSAQPSTTIQSQQLSTDVDLLSLDDSAYLSFNSSSRTQNSHP